MNAISDYRNEMLPAGVAVDYLTSLLHRQPVDVELAQVVTKHYPDEGNVDESGGIDVWMFGDNFTTKGKKHCKNERNQNHISTWELTEGIYNVIALTSS